MASKIGYCYRRKWMHVTKKMMCLKYHFDPYLVVNKVNTFFSLFINTLYDYVKLQYDLIINGKVWKMIYYLLFRIKYVKFQGITKKENLKQ